MIRRIVIISAILMVIAPMALFAGGSSSSNSCDTKYPIVLAHGMGASAEILGIVDYWWGIEDALEDEGASVYVTSVNGMDATASKAADFAAQYRQILAITGKSKGNIVAHSHGTIYTRYAISNLGLANKVSSYTSLCGPHQGSAIADMIMYGVPDSLHGLVAAASDFIYTYIFGDTNPDSLTNGWEMTRNYMQNTFNPNTPDAAGVYYQSWGTKVKYFASSVAMEPTWLILLALEGSNDGLVATSSAPWGNFRGIKTGAWWGPGIDHFNMVNQVMGVTPGFDAPEFYVDMVSELKNWGH
ncbi:MAG: alpha/beta fold hydrolase [bacterium]|nr:alpha/beta fold hydrolase [bacterium]